MDKQFTFKTHKCWISIVILTGLLFCSCERQILPDRKGTKNISFQITNYEQICLDSILNVPHKVRKRVASINILNYLAMGIYDAKTNKLIQNPVIQSSKDQGYGNFNISLPYGKYRMVFLGYDTPNMINMDNPTAISWDKEVVRNTFSKSFILEIDSSTISTQKVSLSRVVGVFSLMIKGNIKKDLDRFKFNIQGGGSVLNAITGFSADQSRTYTFMGQSNYKPDDNITINFYAFLPSTESTATITVTAQDSKEKTIHQRVFKQVPMKINNWIRCSGDFFGESKFAMGYGVEIENDKWEEKEMPF